MWEFKFYSRGGQGSVTAAQILVKAAIKDGKYAQTIPSFGQERQGAPVFTYARVSDEKIDIKSYVYEPNCVVCFDDGLTDIGIDIFEGIVDDTVFILNSKVNKYDNEKIGKTVLIDANGITNELIGDVPPNIAMLGAIAKGTGCVTLENLIEAIKETLPEKVGEINARTCKEAYERAGN